MTADGSAGPTRNAPVPRRLAAALLVAVAVLAGCDEPPPPPLSAPTTSAPTDPARPCSVDPGARRPLAGVEDATFRVVAADGTVRVGCAMLAATPDARGQGLMGQTDLRGYDAMVFRFEAPVSNPFFMFRTPLPLSLAWFDEGGRFVGSTDMDPCTASDGSACPTYRPPAPFLHAVEVAKGRLASLGIGAGATLSFGEGGAG